MRSLLTLFRSQLYTFGKQCFLKKSFTNILPTVSRCLRYFSVRLGSILVAILSMIQSLALSGLLIFWLHYVEETQENISQLVSEFDFFYMEDILTHIIKSGPSIFLKVGVIFLFFHISTCVLLIYAAIKCNIPLIWPFLFMEFVRLILLFLFHITAMIFIKKNSYDLGLLVGLCLLGSFILLGFLYMWLCVYSLCQCIKRINGSTTYGDSKKKKPPFNFRNNNFYLSGFKRNANKIHTNELQPLRLQTVQSFLNNKDFHNHYTNLAWPTK